MAMENAVRQRRKEESWRHKTPYAMGSGGINGLLFCRITYCVSRISNRKKQATAAKPTAPQNQADPKSAVERWSCTSRPQFHRTVQKAHTIIECPDLLQDQRWENRGDTAVNIPSPAVSTRCQDNQLDLGVRPFAGSAVSLPGNKQNRHAPRKTGGNCLPKSTAADEKAALSTIKVVEGAFLPAFSNR